MTGETKMALLDRTQVLYDRDDKGELVPHVVEVVIDEKDDAQLKYKGTTISVIPLARGEIKRFFANTGEKDNKDKDLDADIIVDKCKNPKLTREDVAFMKPLLVTIIVNTILFESGIDVFKASRKEAAQKVEDDFGKNSGASGKIE